MSEHAPETGPASHDRSTSNRHAVPGAVRMDPALAEHCLGRVAWEPGGPVVAGSIGTWTLRYTIGSYGVDEGGTIKLVQRFASDWEAPQFDEPAAPAYTSVSTDGAARLAVRYDRKAHVRPWHRGMVIDVDDGHLSPGDIVTITLGDRSGGSPGMRAQTFIESRHDMLLLVDPTNSNLPQPVPSSPVFPVVAGTAERLVPIMPTRLAAAATGECFVKGEDAWGNPTPVPGELHATRDGDDALTFPEQVATDPESATRIPFTCRGQGTVRLHVRAGTLEATSNPLTVDGTPYRQFWGDLHAQSDATVGTGTESEYFVFARDWARCDFACHQGNDFQMSDEDWKRLNDVVRNANQSNRFAVMPGYEWSANTAAGGDHNVIYPEEDQPIFRSSHWLIEEPAHEQSPAHPAEVFYQCIREHGRALLIAHVGGRYADIRRHFAPDLCPLVEIASCWGVFEWMLHDAFDHGYRVGVVCNSDGHKGRPGAEGPGAGLFGIAGGLTCVLSTELTRDAIFRALRERRCYGTTGARIDLELHLGEAVMGAILEGAAGSHQRLTARARGTAPLEALELYNGRQLERRIRPQAFEGLAGSRRIRLLWGGARMRGRGRRVTWDGELKLDGCQLREASTVAFDSAADGIIARHPAGLSFRSRTTGDVDGFDLILDQTSSGRIHFRSQAGEAWVDLSELEDCQTIDFGGLGMHLSIQRYPSRLHERELSLDLEVDPPADRTTPYYIKAIQEDGQMAWSSPIYCC